MFLRFLQMQVFATLKLLRGLWEPILVPLRPIWSQKGTPKLDQKCSKKGPKTGSEHDPKNNQKVTNFRPQNGPQNGPKIGPKFGNFGVHFLFCWVLKLFGCLFRAFLGLPRLSREASGPQKPSKTEGFLRFLQMQVFGSLKLSMALLGSSWPLLGSIWSQNGPQNGPQNCPKVVQKAVQKTTPNKVNFKPILGPKMGPKIP